MISAVSLKLSSSTTDNITFQHCEAGHPRSITSVISVAASQMSIWPQAMSYLLPCRDMDFVRPVIVCLVGG